MPDSGVFERADQFLGILKTVGGILGQQFSQHRLKLTEPGRQFRDRLNAMHHGDADDIVRPVRRLPGEHFVKHDTEAVKIGAVIQLLAGDLLRAHVNGTADGQSGRGQLGIVGIDQLGDAKIAEHRGAVLAKQDILRLDVAMDNASLVGVGQRHGDGFHDLQGALQAQALFDLLRQGPFREQLHGKIIVGAVRAEIVDRDDLRMLELGDDAPFLQKPIGEALIVDPRRFHDFQGDLATERFLNGEIDGGHTAFADLAHYRVAWNFHHSRTTLSTLGASKFPIPRPISRSSDPNRSLDARARHRSRRLFAPLSRLDTRFAV